MQVGPMLREFRGMDTVALRPPSLFESKEGTAQTESISYDTEMGAPRFDIPNQARFVTFSCYRRQLLFGEDSTRDLFVEHIEAQRQRLEFDVFAYVVMPEHVHAVVLPRDGKIGPVLRGIKQGFGQRMIRSFRDRDDPVLEYLEDSDGLVRFWQRGGGHDRIVRDDEAMRNHIEYIHFNPVKRGLVERGVDWKWSSARDYAGESGVVEIRKGW